MLSDHTIEDGRVASTNDINGGDRTRLEAAFREGAQPFHEMIDALPAAIYTTDAEGHLTHFNPAAVEFSGRVPALGSDQWCVTWKLYYPDGRPMAHDECPMALTLKEGRVVRGEAIAERPDGKRIWFEAYPSPLFDDEGRIVGGINMLVDVTEGKEAERQLRQSERELADFFEAATVAMHWVGPDGIILRVNQAELDLLGYSHDEYVGRHIADFYADRGEIDDILRRLSAAEELHDCEARLRCKDGSIRHVLINSNVRWENGQFIHTRCITHDVTERKQAEEALRESEERYRALVEATSHIVWTANAAGEFDSEQSDWGAYTGQTFDEYRGFGWTEALHPDARARSESVWQRALSNGMLYENECRIRRHDGEYRWFAVRAAPVRDESGAIREWVGTDTDITERKEAEEALRESEAQLGADLADARRLQAISTQLIYEENIEALYEQILDAAAGIMRADFASMQLLHPERGSGELHLLAFRGFNPEAARFWEWVRADSDSTCGMALRSGERVIAPDVEKSEFMAGTEDLATYLQTGIRAVQTTPLVSRAGQVLGMISTHWREAHQPSERDLRLLDILARQAADLVERKLAEEALRYRTEQVETLIDQAPLGVYLVDADFCIRDVNPVALPVFGDIPGGVIGRDFDEIIHLLWEKAYADEVVRIFRHTLATGESYVTPEQAEFRIDRGITEYYEWRLDRIFLPDGRFGVVCYFRDISQQVKARLKIAASKKALRRLNESLEAQVAERTAALAESEAQIRRMASTLTMAEQEERRRIAQVLHDDLQQQLYGVQMKMSFARHEMESGDIESALKSIADAETWLGEGIQSSRRLTVDLSPPILKSEGLADMLGWLISQMREIHKVKVALAAEHPFQIADEDMRVLLFQTVRELLFNVVKHASAEHAAVELEDGDGCLVIRVSDDGRGFDVSQAARADGEGGFGLFSARERLGLFGGRMAIESAPGEGTRVTLSVPLDSTGQTP